MSESDSRIASFWEWFESNHTTLEDIVSEKDPSKTEFFVQQLDEHILSFGRLKWSVANPSENHFILTISPNNDRDLLRITATIIQNAPSIPNWRFYDAIQPDGKLEITLYDSDMNVQAVNAKEWEFLLEPSDNDLFNLIIKVVDTEHLDEDTEMVAVDLILSSLLGERYKIERIEELEIIDTFEDADLPYAKPIQSLLDSIA